MSGGYSALWCAGFSLRWLLLLQSTGSRHAGFSSCGTRTQQLWPEGLFAPRHVGSSQTRARTRVPCIGRQILNHCATREVPVIFFNSCKAKAKAYFTHKWAEQKHNGPISLSVKHPWQKKNQQQIRSNYTGFLVISQTCLIHTYLRVSVLAIPSAWCTFPQISPWLTLVPPSALYANITSLMKSSLATPSKSAISPHPHSLHNRALFSPQHLSPPNILYVLFVLFIFCLLHSAPPENKVHKVRHFGLLCLLLNLQSPEEHEHRVSTPQNVPQITTASWIPAAHRSTENSKGTHCNYPNPHQPHREYNR